MRQDSAQVEVDEHEEVIARAAAIDVAKASGMVCTRVPHRSKTGRRVTTVWNVSATTNAIIELAEHLAEQRIQRVVVESTSDYWRPFVYLCEARGLTVWLVNARDVKQVPGRPKIDPLTELSAGFRRWSVRLPAGVATFPRRVHGRRCAPGVVRAGCGAAGVA